ATEVTPPPEVILPQASAPFVILRTWPSAPGPGLKALAVTAPSITLAAEMAYGAEATRTRGSSVTKLALPLVRTATSIQRFTPRKGAAPKSKDVLKRPLITPTAKLVIGPPKTRPLVSIL